jgi:hypothetical protein
MAAALSGCETAFSGPMAGQTRFVTDGAPDAASGTDSCVDPAPVVATARNIGNTTALSDAPLGGDGC